MIVCHFCLHACSNDDYAYRHLAAIHLNIQWGCGACHRYVSRYLLKIREHVQSHQKRSSKESHSSRKKTDSGHSDSSSDGVSSDEEWSAGELGEEEEDDDDKESSPSSEVSSDDSDLE